MAWQRPEEAGGGGGPGGGVGGDEEPPPPSAGERARAVDGGSGSGDGRGDGCSLDEKAAAAGRARKRPADGSADEDAREREARGAGGVERERALRRKLEREREALQRMCNGLAVDLREAVEARSEAEDEREALVQVGADLLWLPLLPLPLLLLLLSFYAEKCTTAMIGGCRVENRDRGSPSYPASSQLWEAATKGECTWRSLSLARTSLLSRSAHFVASRFAPRPNNCKTWGV